MSPSFLSNSEPGMSSWHWTPCSAWVSVDSTLSKDNTGQRFPLTGRLRPCWGSPPDGEQTKKSWLKTSTEIHSTVLCDMPSRSIVSYYRWEKQGPAMCTLNTLRENREPDTGCSAGLITWFQRWRIITDVIKYKKANKSSAFLSAFPHLTITLH